MRWLPTILLLGIPVAVIASFLVFERLRDSEPDVPRASTSLRVVASIFPIAEFLREVGGEQVTVQTLVLPGVEPHEYEPTPQDVIAVRTADAFFLHGGGIDPWAERIAGENHRSITMVTELGGPARLQTIEGVTDPHVWLDPSLAAEEVTAVTRTLRMLDPAHASSYEERGAAFRDKILNLQKEFAAGLSRCELRTFITDHAAFHYLARAYGLENLSLLGLSTGEDPSPKRVAEITAIAKRKGVPIIFYEPLEGRRLADTIAAEATLEVLPLDSLEGVTTKREQGTDTFLSLMAMNLSSLRRALRCR